ncbi:MAG: aldehyde dehydrogenase family protein [Balneola sp.]|jgi:aldehyde dehydrogenase (NAD+)|nr:aldehyde dehydrogenase family protein [Balneola sp.]MBE77943.1 aldehyde dehydrogenase family protein [Balneola sp.]|tara:strand:+ start:23655 stop:25022 length:1368 start_codon:yes stop_codon:yes gene_type:complete
MDGMKLLDRQRTYFRSGATKSVDFRIHQLETLKKMLTQHEQEFNQAVYNDFKKPELEMYATEIGILYNEISYVLKKLKKWTKPQKVSGSWVNFPSKNYTVAEPYGSVLIIAPWNYPVQLALLPVVGAIAAGNTVVIKPSELTPNTSRALKEIVGKWFKEEFVAVVEGGVETNKELLAQDFDYIFFTGSTRVGKLVMEAAAKNLTPVTLELGGKSPCIVDESADLETAARRIAWGKFVNAGQTCVAPDYLLVQSSIEKKFLENFENAVTEFYGNDPKKSPDYPRIVNEDHFNRLVGYLDDGKVFLGGDTDSNGSYISPTVLTDIRQGAEIMEEEIFGPILPVLTFDELPEAIDMIKSKPKPLALYLFTKKTEAENAVLEKCSFGGGAINDTLAHLGNHNLPFGGVGSSGMGAYHGKRSFETFSHTKSIMKKSFWLDIPFRYAPYEGKLKWIKRVLK